VQGSIPVGGVIARSSIIDTSTRGRLPHIAASCRPRGADPDAFLSAVRDAECAEEIRNPFVLDAMLKQYHDRGSLNPLRSENVRYVVEQLIQSRPTFGTILQRRALKMLAITCETVARNELTIDEALRVLLEAIEFPAQTARDLLDELSHSILIRTAGGISFQMRSYGEYLAAEELHDKSVDRLKELAFINEAPVDSWGNAITYLAEMNHKVRQYFTRHHPEWLVNVSPAAFSEGERTALCKQVLRDVNQTQTYIVDHKTISLRRFSRLLTPTVTAESRAQLTSTQPHEVANALVLLAIQHQPDIVPVALRLATEHRNASSLRYSAIVALINADDHLIINDLIVFADPSDTYYINVVDTIGSLCTPGDFPRVLPLLKIANAGLSSAFYHFRELTTKEALTAAVDYAIAKPATLDGYDLDSYLVPLFDLIPRHWGNDVAAALGLLFAALERDQFTDHHGKLAQNIIKHIATKDHEALAIQSLITALATDGTRLRFIDHLIAPLITLPAAQWINQHANQYVADLIPWLPLGPARELLAPLSPEVVQAQDEVRERYIKEQQERDQAITTTRNEHQNTIQTATTIGEAIIACERLPKEHWPEISSAQRTWLAQQVNDTLVQFNLAHSVTWQTENVDAPARPRTTTQTHRRLQPTPDERCAHRPRAKIVARHGNQQLLPQGRILASSTGRAHQPFGDSREREHHPPRTYLPARDDPRYAITKRRAHPHRPRHGTHPWNTHRRHRTPLKRRDRNGHAAHPRDRPRPCNPRSRVPASDQAATPCNDKPGTRNPK
jgi:hypothetical protein